MVLPPWLVSPAGPPGWSPWLIFIAGPPGKKIFQNAMLLTKGRKSTKFCKGFQGLYEILTKVWQSQSQTKLVLGLREQSSQSKMEVLHT